MRQDAVLDQPDFHQGSSLMHSFSRTGSKAIVPAIRKVEDHSYEASNFLQLDSCVEG